jgi:curved DNA-binding protein CbpA
MRPAAEPPPQPTAEGTLTRTPLVHLLVYMLDQRLTGTTVFHSPEGAIHGVHFLDGAPAKVRTGTTVAPLDRVLLELGLLDEPTLRGTLMEISKKRMLHGRHLVARGLLDREGVIGALRYQVARKVIHLFELPPETRYAYYDGVNLLASYGGPELTPAEPLALIMAGVRLRSDDPLVAATLDRITGRPIALHLDAEMRRFELTREETAVCDLLRAKRMTLDDLLGAGLAQEHVVRLTIYALAITRHLDLGVPGRPPVGVGGREKGGGSTVVPKAVTIREAPAQAAERINAAATDGAGTRTRESARQGGGQTGPRPTDLAPDGMEPRQEQPGRTQPWTDSPNRTQPRPGSPGEAQPLQGSPGRTQPWPSSPGKTQPRANPPGGTQPRQESPGGTPPRTNLPGGTQPRTNLPGGTQPRTNLPGGTQPRTHLPGGTQPRTNLPGGTQPRTHLPAAPRGPTDAFSSSSSPTPTSPVAPEHAPRRAEPVSGARAVAERQGESAPAAGQRPSPDSAARRAEMERRLQTVDQENYFELLGLAQDATHDQVQKAYFAIAKMWHPDRLPADLDDLKPHISRAFSRFNEAYQTLNDPLKRAEYTQSLADGDGQAEQEHIGRVVEAALDFQKAEVLLKKHDLLGAEALVKRALSSDPDQPEYLTLLVWIQAQRRGDPPAMEEGRETSHYDDLIKALDKVIGKEPRYERALFYRGMLLKRAGRSDKALRDFRLAADINPKNLDAVREVRVHDMRRRGAAGQTGGLLGKFFNKK